MCIFSRSVEHVSATRIFARGLEDGRQVLAYAMQLSSVHDLAMVLPIPVPPGSPEDAIEMVDLSRYPELFGDLNRAMPVVAMGGGVPMAAASPARLVVHEVGAFDVSFVPSPADFGRLDLRYRLSRAVLAALPQYADWGFVVVQLGAGRRHAVHPIAFCFPRRDPEAVFFPTLHVHDGRVPTVAQFDHSLYAQLPPLLAALTRWQASERELGAYVNAARTQLVDALAPGFAETRVGPAPNEDIVLRAPAGITLADLWGVGPGYRYRVGTRSHFTPLVSHLQWHATSKAKLAALCQGLRVGLADLTARHAHAWRLGRSYDAPASHYMNGNDLIAAHHVMAGAPPPGGPISVAFNPWTDLVEFQEITFSFTELPTRERAREIHGALCRLLDRCVA